MFSADVSIKRPTSFVARTCEAADQEVTNTFGIQRFAEREEVFELRCA